jgi:UDP-glucose 4-epimerase
MYRKILVTGGAGFIGSQLVRDLLARGYGVTVLDDLSTGSNAYLAECVASKNFRFLKGSVAEPNAVIQAVEKCDVVFHLAVSNLRTSIQNPQASHDVNTTGTFRMLEECRKQGVERFLYISSSEIYGTASHLPLREEEIPKPTTLYASSKLAGELYTESYRKLYGLQTTILRPFNNYGYRSHHEGMSGEMIPRTVFRLLNGLPPILFGSGNQTRDFIFVTDTSRALIEALETPKSIGATINIASGKEISMRTLAEMLCEAIAPNLQPVFLGADRPGDIPRLLGDTRQAEEILKFTPQVSLGEGLSLYVDWVRAQGFHLPSLLNEMKERNW